MPHAMPRKEPDGEPRANAQTSPLRVRRGRETSARDLGRLTDLAGVGPARAKAFARLGVECVRDLLLLMPQRLEVHGPPVTIEAACQPDTLGSVVTVDGTVERTHLVRMGGRRSLLRVTIADETGSIDAVFFNQPWMAERFLKGDPFRLRGKVVDAKGPALASPRVGTEEKPLPEPGSLVPIYPLAEGLSQDFVRKLCAEAVARCASELSEPLTDEVLERFQLVPLTEAVRELHAPSSEEAFVAARRRLALEPLLELAARLHERRAARDAGRAFPSPIDDTLDRELRDLLPYTLTPGQDAVVADLRTDLARSVPMRRLLQGDVGCGKTLVGVYACLAVARAGGQSAFLAPTELLAEQHRHGLKRLLQSAGLNSVLLTGSLPAAERRRVLAALASGEVQVAFGTHALFSDDVRYRNLALAVIDEQHRFGVAQRARLFDKGDDVHALLMTATPIPRTLALTLYGDLDTSVLSGAPPGRGAVRTRWVRGHDRRRVPSFLTERLEAGEQVYWVVPRIGSVEDEESGISGAESAFEKLRQAPIAKHGIELVHGRVPAAERSARLERFRRGDARVLVATTVIEVGVDVPAATVMVIENAERLGLAQLHQLRGRIGRGPRESWCLLFGDKVAEERFLVLERTCDGFEIAEEDLRRRGMGDLAGVRQAGENAEGLADPGLDLELVIAARDLVARYPEVLREYSRPGKGTVTP